jgi:uncharacterized glyoxalase superfamily protein PhnB
LVGRAAWPEPRGPAGQSEGEPDAQLEAGQIERGEADGANVLQPLSPAQWAPLYGMLKDRFGIIWVVDVVSEYSAS